MCSLFATYLMMNLSTPASPHKNPTLIGRTCHRVLYFPPVFATKLKQMAITTVTIATHVMTTRSVKKNECWTITSGHL